MPRKTASTASDTEDETDVIVNKNVDFARSKRAWFVYILMFLVLRHFLEMVDVPRHLGWTVLHVVHCLVHPHHHQLVSYILVHLMYRQTFLFGW